MAEYMSTLLFGRVTFPKEHGFVGLAGRTVNVVYDAVGEKIYLQQDHQEIPGFYGDFVLAGHIAEFAKSHAFRCNGGENQENI